jgi:hypothetical protein
MENNNELEMMRAQVALLKEKLDKEQMVSEKMLRSIIKKTVRKLTRERMLSLVFILIFIPFLIYVLVTEFNMSMVFAFVFGLYMIAAMAYTFYAERGLNNKTVGTDRLVDTGRRLIRLKRLQARWLRISIPISVILLTWMYLEVTPELSYSIPFYRGCGFGAVFGGVIAAIIYMKRRRELKECIRQIEDLTGEKLD